MTFINDISLGNPSSENMNSLEYRGFHSRRITQTAHLLTGCFHTHLYGRQFYTHASAYLLQGEKGNILIDTGHAKDGPRIEAYVRSVVGDELTYIFPTHEECPPRRQSRCVVEGFSQGDRRWRSP